MYRYCKLCKECLLLDHSIEGYKADKPTLYIYRCHLCPMYALLLEDSQQIWEQINIGNLRLIVFSEMYSGNTTLRGSALFEKIVNCRPDTLHQFPLKELTHELAVQWVNKLKTYLTFQ